MTQAAEAHGARRHGPTEAGARAGGGQVPDASHALDVERIRADFPVLDQQVHGKPLVYLDNAASAQTPRPVIEALVRFYEHDYANIHRGVHELSQRATTAYEEARAKLVRFVAAGDESEVVFTSGTTDAINLVASTFGRAHVGAGDEIVISTLEHHSNIVPWQMLCEEKGATLKVAPINDQEEPELDAFERLLGPRTRLVAMAHVSNALGTINPVAEVIARAHARSIPVLLDGAQAAPHLAIDVRALDVDFYALSGHKMYGPTGVGILYAKRAHLDAMPPYRGGGDMIHTVTFEKTVYADPPSKFEAGTPNIADGIALGAAVDYLEALGLDAVAAHEHALLVHGTERLAAIDGLRLVGTAAEKAGVLSFVMEGIPSEDVGHLLNRQGIAVRTGHHCTMPLMARLGLPGTVRASLAVYNTFAELDALADGLERVKRLFA